MLPVHDARLLLRSKFSLYAGRVICFAARQASKHKTSLLRILELLESLVHEGISKFLSNSASAADSLWYIMTTLHHLNIFITLRVPKRSHAGLACHYFGAKKARCLRDAPHVVSDISVNVACTHHISEPLRLTPTLTLRPSTSSPSKSLVLSPSSGLGPQK